MSKIIGKGTYGCVYKPPPKCKNPEDCPPTKEKCVKGVAKLTFEKEAKEEVEHVSMIDKIDLNQIYHIGDPVVCDPEESFDTRGCNVIEEEEEEEEEEEGSEEEGKKKQPTLKDLKFLIYDDGGAIFNDVLFSDNLDAVKFIKGFENIFFAIKEMSKHGFVHADIKAPNIMVDAKYNFKLIDFGLSWNTIPIVQSDYEIWPFEYPLLGSQEYGNNEDEKIEKVEGYRIKVLRDDFNSTLGKVVSDKFWNKFKHTSGRETFKSIKSKVDLYSLGIMIKKYILIKQINYDIKNFFKSLSMKELVEQMIDENFYERLTPQQAYDRYLEISKEYLKQL